MSKSPEVLANEQKILSLRKAISQKPPLVFGTSPIPKDQGILFYGKDEHAQ
jgi:hypothetical protein